MRDTFVKILSEHAKSDRNIVLITADLGFGVLTKFRDTYPEQFLNVGVAEQNMAGVATGLALSGKKVFTYSIANFPTLRCLEQIRNDICYHEANVKIISIGGGFSYGALGMSHHATEDLAIMRSLPGMTVLAPCDKWEVERATEAAINLPGPCYLRLDKSSAETNPLSKENFQVGKARVLREGTDGTLIACGGIVAEALVAAEQLCKKGISCRVISFHSIKPLDTEIIYKACAETGGIFTIEEHNIIGGLGSAVAESCLDMGCSPKVFKRIGLRDCYSSIVGSQDYLRQKYEMDAAAIEHIVCASL